MATVTLEVECHMPNQLWPPPLLIDLFRFSGVLFHKRIKLLKSGLPGKRDFIHLNQQLLSPLDLTDLRSFEDTGYLLFLYEIGYQLDFFEESDGALKPNRERAALFLGLSPYQQQQELLDAYQRMVLWNESLSLEEVRFHTSDDEEDAHLPLAQLFQARRQILTWLSEAEDQEPLSQWFQRARQDDANYLGLAPESGKGVYPTVLLQVEGNSQPARYPRDWEEIEGRFLKRVLQTSLTWLGCVRLDDADDPEVSLAETYLTEETLPPSIAGPSELVLQSNHDLLLFPGHNQLALIAELESFCRPIDGERILRYKLDKRRFFQALQQGDTYEQMRQLLERHSRTSIPLNIDQLLQSWHQQSNQIVISKKGAVLQTDTQEELIELLTHWPKGVPYTIASQRAVFVPFYAHEPLRRWLASRPKLQEINYARKLPTCLRIDAQLQIQVVPPFDLLVEPFLSRIATRLEPDPAYPTRPLFEMTQETLQRAQEGGLSFDEILDFLEARAKVFSSTAKLRLEAFAGQLGQVYMGATTLLMTEDPQTMDRLFHEGGMGDYLHRIGPTASLLPPTLLKEAQAALKTFSLPNQDDLSSMLAPPAPEEEDDT